MPCLQKQGAQGVEDLAGFGKMVNMMGFDSKTFLPAED